jgi:hypothetical protein
MKFEATICHTHLMSMLLMPEQFQRAISSYTATSPDVANEGFNGYMEVKVSFVVRDLEAFTELYKQGYVFPSDRSQWYQFIKNGIDKFNEK